MASSTASIAALCALLLALTSTISIVHAARTGVLAAADVTFDCSAPILAALESELASAQTALATTNGEIDTIASDIAKSQLTMDENLKIITDSRANLRGQTVALAALEASYGDKVSAYASQLTQYRAAFEAIQGQLPSSSSTKKEAKLRLRVPAGKTGEEHVAAVVAAAKAKVAARVGAETAAAAEAWASSASSPSSSSNSAVVPSSDTSTSASDVSESSLSSIDSSLGSSSLGSSSSIPTDADSTTILFIKAANEIRTAVASLKYSHSASEASYLSSKTTLLSAISTDKEKIKTAASANAAQAIDSAQLQARLVQFLQTANTYESSIVTINRQIDAYNRKCS